MLKGMGQILIVPNCYGKRYLKNRSRQIKQNERFLISLACQEIRNFCKHDSRQSEKFG